MTKGRGDVNIACDFAAPSCAPMLNIAMRCERGLFDCDCEPTAAGPDTLPGDALSAGDDLACSVVTQHTWMTLRACIQTFRTCNTGSLVCLANSACAKGEGQRRRSTSNFCDADDATG